MARMNQNNTGLTYDEIMAQGGTFEEFTDYVMCGFLGAEKWAEINGDSAEKLEDMKRKSQQWG